MWLREWEPCTHVHATAALAQVPSDVKSGPKRAGLGEELYNNSSQMANVGECGMGWDIAQLNDLVKSVFGASGVVVAP